MVNRIVSSKELREAVRKEILVAADVSPDARKAKRITGKRGAQMSIAAGVSILQAIISQYDANGRTLDKSMVDLLTPRGARRYVSSQLNCMATVRLVRGANPIETVYRTLGDLVVVGRSGRENVYQAKAGITSVELLAAIGLRTGKINAAMARNEEITGELKKGAALLADRRLDEVYAETVAEVFQVLKAA